MGNHTFHHPDMSAISDQSKFQQELEELEQLYQETTGQTLPRFYRPPQGKYSEENLRQAQALGYPHPCSGAWPMWTGTRTTSPPGRRLSTSSSPGCIPGR